MGIKERWNAAMAASRRRDEAAPEPPEEPPDPFADSKRVIAHCGKCAVEIQLWLEVALTRARQYTAQSRGSHSEVNYGLGLEAGLTEVRATLRNWMES